MIGHDTRIGASLFAIVMFLVSCSDKPAATPGRKQGALSQERSSGANTRSARQLEIELEELLHAVGAAQQDAEAKLAAFEAVKTKVAEMEGLGFAMNQTQRRMLGIPMVRLTEPARRDGKLVIGGACDEGVAAVAFAPSGQLVYALDGRGFVRAFSTADGAFIEELHMQQAIGMAACARSDTLAVFGSPYRIGLWPTRREGLSFFIPGIAQVEGTGVEYEIDHVAGSAGAPFIAMLGEVNDLDLVERMIEEAQNLKQIRLAKSAGRMVKLWLWQPAAGRRCTPEDLMASIDLDLEMMDTEDVVVSASGSHVACVAQDLVLIVDVAQKKVVQSTEFAAADNVAISPRGAVFAYAWVDAQSTGMDEYEQPVFVLIQHITVARTDTGKEIGSFEVGTNHVRNISFLPSGDAILLLGGEEHMRLISARSGKLLGPVPAPDVDPTCVAYSADGASMAVSAAGSVVVRSVS